MQQPPILSIQMVPAGIELVLRGLNKLPREESDPLFQEINGQYQYQMQELANAANAREDILKAEAAAKAAAAAEKAAKKAAAKKPAGPMHAVSDVQEETGILD